MFIEVHGKSTI